MEYVVAEAPKKRPGRPRKSAIDKPEQFSIRLPMLSKLMLEMIARDKNLSLSQAVDYVIRQAAGEIYIEDIMLATAARHGLGRLLYLVAEDPYYEGGMNPGTRSVSLFNISGGHLTDAEKAVMLPESLRTDHEEYFYQVVIDLGRYHSVFPMRNKSEGMELFNICQTAQMTGVKPFQVAESWLAHHPAPEPPPDVQPAIPSGPSIPKPENKKK